jgi:hypothetical protein
MRFLANAKQFGKATALDIKGERRKNSSASALQLVHILAQSH